MAIRTFFDVKFAYNRIEMYGDLRLNGLDDITHALHHIGVQARYPDIVLDMTNVTSVMPSVAAPLAAYLRYLTQQYKIDYTFIQPRNGAVASRIRDIGLAHYIDFRNFDKPKSNSSKPAIMQFFNTEQCMSVTDKILNSVIRTIRLDRENIAALEWAVNEMADNVINHAQSPVGGFAIHSRVHKTNIVEFTIADCGIGVARTLGIKDEAEALSRAIEEGVTRDKHTNQGNGLYGTFRLACASSGIFSLRSRHGALFVDKGGDVRARRGVIPFHGTIVTCQIDCDEAGLIARAFNFKGISHNPTFDYIEKMHEKEDRDVWVKAREICKTFGSRESGKEARLYIENLISATDGSVVHIDLDNVPVISSSFADEVFGKLFVQMGSMKFMRLIKIENCVSTVEGLIGRAIDQRSRTGLFTE